MVPKRRIRACREWWTDGDCSCCGKQSNPCMQGMVDMQVFLYGAGLVESVHAGNGGSRKRSSQRKRGRIRACREWWLDPHLMHRASQSNPCMQGMVGASHVPVAACVVESVHAGNGGTSRTTRSREPSRIRACEGRWGLPTPENCWRCRTRSRSRRDRFRRLRYTPIA